MGGSQQAFAQKVHQFALTNVTAPNAENADAITRINLQNEFEGDISAANLTRMSILGNANAIAGYVHLCSKAHTT